MVKVGYHQIDFQGLDDTRITGPGQAGDPSSNFDNTVPGGEAQTAEDRAANGVNIYVYPNPATREALEEFQQLQPAGDDPTGVRVVFANLPMANNTVKIFTISGLHRNSNGGAFKLLGTFVRSGNTRSHCLIEPFSSRARGAFNKRRGA